jgi:hypothetical protein
MLANFMLVSCLAYTSTLNMEAIRSFETSADFQHNIRVTSQETELFIYISLFLLWCQVDLKAWHSKSTSFLSLIYDLYK